MRNKILNHKLALAYTLMLIFVYTCVLTRSFNVSFTDEDSRHYIRGDGYSDRNTFSAIRYWQDHSYLSSALRPMHDYSSEGTGQAYTHYPAFPDLFSSLASSVFGAKTEAQIRIWTTLFSIFVVFLFYKFISLFIFDPWQRFWSLSLLLASNYFIFFADNLHKHVHEFFVNWLWALLLYYFYRYKKHKVLYIVAPFLTLWTTHSSFESIVVAAALVLGSSLMFETTKLRKILSPLNIYLGILFVLGFILHLYLNRLQLGSWLAVKEDMLASLAHRTGAGPSDVPISFFNIVTLPLRFVHRMHGYFFVPGWTFILFCYWVLQDWKKKDVFNYKFIVILITASFAWYIVMPQHAFVHHFTAKHFGFIAGIVMVPGLVILYQKTKSATFGPKIFYLLIWSYILFMALTQIVYPSWWKHSLRFLFS